MGLRGGGGRGGGRAEGLFSGGGMGGGYCVELRKEEDGTGEVVCHAGRDGWVDVRKGLVGV